jgi:LysM repeat protein
MPELDDNLLVPRGTPAREDEPGVALQTSAYSALMEFVQMRVPAETAGALIGTMRDGAASGRVQIHITSVTPLSLVSARSGVVPSQVEWEKLKARLAAEGGETKVDAERIVGWFYADPGIGIFPRRIDLVAAHDALAPDAGLLLLVNPASDRGAFYAWRRGDFAHIAGFYEALDEPGADAAIPWGGEVPGADEWMRGVMPAAGGAQADGGIGGYTHSDEAHERIASGEDRRRARLIAGVVLGLIVAAALVGSLFLFGRLGQVSPAPIQTQATPTASATPISSIHTVTKETATPKPTSVPTAIPTATATTVVPTAMVEPDSTSTPTIAAQPTPTLRTYTVKRGDTLTTIAAQFSTTPQAIMATNGLKSTVIAVGQLLTIPGPAAPQTANPVATPAHVITQLPTPVPIGTEPIPHAVPSAISTVGTR